MQGLMQSHGPLINQTTNQTIKSSQSLCCLNRLPLPFRPTVPTVLFYYLTNCSIAAAAAISAILTVPFYALTNYSAVPTAVLIIPFCCLTVLPLLFLPTCRHRCYYCYFNCFILLFHLTIPFYCFNCSPTIN